MPTYQYQTKTSAGLIDAASLAAAGAALRAKGVEVVDLAPAEGAKKKFALADLAKVEISLGPGAKDIAAFTSQLAVMVRAGISLRAAVEGIAEQTENAKFKVMLEQVRRDVEGGRAFSDALARYPKKFGPLYVNMVRASELSGGFSKMLDRIAGFLQQQIETAAMVRGAMIYPGIIGGLAVTVTIFLLTFVLPRFMVIFKGKEAALPVPTKVLLALSAFMVDYWYVVILGLAALVAGVWFALRTERGSAAFDVAKLRVPVFKKLFRALYISRSLQTLGQLLNAGVPMLDALAVTGEISGNVLYKRMWMDVYAAVKQGRKVSDPLVSSKLLPRAVVQMVAAGEESGKLGEVLDEVSEYYGRELKAAIKTATSMVEPVMIIVMGGVVGFIAMSIILPIFKLSSLVG